ncbi:MAG: efflux RND transporter periplasmic adaptor subunit, partial [candidate division KSB1 bacterium]|nr:efflux RND transporter periplasmic adaptor subunit [candidate division KSB1 bacterium]
VVFFNLRRGRGDEIEVQTEKVRRSDVLQTVSGSGKVKPVIEVKISANVSGEIVKLHVQEGDPVRKGQVLVELDRTRYLAALDRARSAVKSAEANLIKARSDYQRAQELFARNLYSQAELEGVKASLTLAESSVEEARAAFNQAQDDLAKTTLTSPIDGTVIQLNKEVGEIALGSQFTSDVIMTVGDLSEMEMIAQIDENDVILIDVGDSAKLEVDALPDQPLACTVTKIANSATTIGRGTQEEITNFDVTVKILENHPKLRPGMSATVDIQTDRHENVLNIPLQCVTVRPKSDLKDTTLAYMESRAARREREEKNKVREISANEEAQQEPAVTAKKDLIEVAFVVRDGKAVMVPVITGISDETHVEVTSGLQENDEVITGPYRILSRVLKDGDRVKVKNEEAPKKDGKKEQS